MDSLEMFTTQFNEQRKASVNRSKIKVKDSLEAMTIEHRQHIERKYPDQIEYWYPSPKEEPETEEPEASKESENQPEPIDFAELEARLNGILAKLK